MEEHPFIDEKGVCTYAIATDSAAARRGPVLRCREERDEHTMGGGKAW